MKFNILFLTINDVSVLELMTYTLEESLDGTSIDILDASTDKDAMKILESERIDLIIADMNIDTIESYTFYDNLQLIDKYKEIPFIFLSSDIDDQEIAFLKGINNFFLKPLNADQVLETLKGILNRSEINDLLEYEHEEHEKTSVEIISINIKKIENLLQEYNQNNHEEIKNAILIIKEQVDELSPIKDDEPVFLLS